MNTESPRLRGSLGETPTSGRRITDVRTVVVEWGYDCPGCFGFGRVGMSGALVLQDASWFDDCLAAPTTESLIACTVGLVEIETGNPPEGYAPPFTTGECTTLDVACR